MAAIPARNVAASDRGPMRHGPGLMQATFQTRLRTEPAEDALLDRWVEFYARVQHQLFAAYSETGDVKTLDQRKSETCARHGITARHFNAVSVSLKGKIASRQAVDKAALVDVKVALASIRKTLTRLERQKTPQDSLQRRVYTSVIGRVKYAKPLGVSVHQAAALVIARRGMGYGEAAPARPVIPDGKGDHLIVELPVRNRSMHEWSHGRRCAPQA